MEQGMREISRIFLALVTALALTGACSEEPPPAADGGQDRGTTTFDAGALDLRQDRGGKLPDLGPDRPRAPAHWSKVPGSVQPVCYDHTATLLPSGKVLIVGGLMDLGGNEVYKSDVYLFDPAASRFQKVASLATARAEHTATLLKDGKVLVTGGQGNTSYLASTELYDPKTNKWTAGPKMPYSRFGHAAARLPGGQVLISGGFTSSDSTNSLLIYDPTQKIFGAPSSTMKEARRYHTMTPLRSGSVLIAGGLTGRGLSTYTSLDSLEIFTTSGSTQLVPQAMHWKRVAHTATLLGDGRVLLVGGLCWRDCTGSKVNDIYDPGTNKVSQLTFAGTPPTAHVAALLKDGRVLIAGSNGSKVEDRKVAYLYNPKGGLMTWVNQPSMAYGRASATGTTLNDGRVLVVGGEQEYESYPPVAELYHP
jgi:N-acetylneuraminic acid mutarotase